jgi:ferredoxin-NADP reductase
VGAALLWWRVIEVVRHATADRVRVLSVRRENRDTVSIVLSWPRGRGAAGQFIRCRFLRRGQWWQSHPYSLSAPPRRGRLRITVKALGDHSAELAQTPIGTRVLVAGPYGATTDRQRQGDKVLLVAGGVGITPMRALFEATAAKDAVLLYRAHRQDELVFRTELDRLAKNPRRRVHYLVGNRTRTPMTPAAFRRLVPDVADRDAYVCGPDGFMRTVRRGLVGAGVSPGRIHWESFDLGEDG